MHTCVCVCAHARMHAHAQLCLNLCEAMDCSPPGSSGRGILQARILEQFAVPSSRGSSEPGTEPGSPEFQTDSLSSEPLGKPKDITNSIILE